MYYSVPDFGIFMFHDGSPTDTLYVSQSRAELEINGFPCTQIPKMRDANKIIGKSLSRFIVITCDSVCVSKGAVDVTDSLIFDSNRKIFIMNSIPWEVSDCIVSNLLKDSRDMDLGILQNISIAERNLRMPNAYWMVFPKEVFDAVGGFDENLYCLHEMACDFHERANAYVNFMGGSELITRAVPIVVSRMQRSVKLPDHERRRNRIMKFAATLDLKYLDWRTPLNV